MAFDEVCDLLMTGNLALELSETSEILVCVCVFVLSGDLYFGILGGFFAPSATTLLLLLFSRLRLAATFMVLKLTKRTELLS